MLTDLTVASSDIYLIREATRTINRTIRGSDVEPLANHPVSVTVVSRGLRVMGDVTVYATDIRIDVPDDCQGPDVEAYLDDCRRTQRLARFTGYAVSKQVLVRRSAAHARLHPCQTVAAPYGDADADSVIASFFSPDVVPCDDRVRAPMNTAREYDAVSIDPVTVDRYVAMYAAVFPDRMVQLDAAQHLAWIVANGEHAANARVPRIYDVTGLDADITSDDGTTVIEFLACIVGDPDGVSLSDGRVRLDHDAVTMLVDNARHSFGEAGDGHVELVDAGTHRYELWFGGDAYEITPVY